MPFEIFASNVRGIKQFSLSTAMIRVLPHNRAMLISSLFRRDSFQVRHQRVGRCQAPHNRFNEKQVPQTRPVRHAATSIRSLAFVLVSASLRTNSPKPQPEIEAYKNTTDEKNEAKLARQLFLARGVGTWRFACPYIRKVQLSLLHADPPKLFVQEKRRYYPTHCNQHKVEHRHWRN